MEFWYKRWLWRGCIFVYLYAPISIAATSINTGHWFTGGEAAWVWLNSNKKTTSVLNGHKVDAPSNVDLYSISHLKSATSWSVYGGYRWPRRHAPFASVALRYQYLTHFNVGGQIEQYSMSNMKDYAYNMNVNANIFSVLGKLDIIQYGPISPYVSIGIGCAFNNMHQYREYPMTGIIPRLSPNYHASNNGSFEYSFGSGIDYIINHQFWMSLGYEYANLGKIKSSGATGPNWSRHSLSLGNLSSNSVLLGLFYQFSR